MNTYGASGPPVFQIVDETRNELAAFDENRPDYNRAFAHARARVSLIATNPRNFYTRLIVERLYGFRINVRTYERAKIAEI